MARPARWLPGAALACVASISRPVAAQEIQLTGPLAIGYQLNGPIAVGHELEIRARGEVELGALARIPTARSPYDSPVVPVLGVRVAFTGHNVAPVPDHGIEASVAAAAGPTLGVRSNERSRQVVLGTGYVIRYRPPGFGPLSLSAGAGPSAEVVDAPDDHEQSSVVRSKATRSWVSTQADHASFGSHYFVGADLLVTLGKYPERKLAISPRLELLDLYTLGSKSERVDLLLATVGVGFDLSAASIHVELRTPAIHP